MGFEFAWWWNGSSFDFNTFNTFSSYRKERKGLRKVRKGFLICGNL